MFQCQECGRKFRTTKAAGRAANNGCPGCGGVDIDLAPAADRKPAGYNKQAGYLLGPNGMAVCPGVVCRCREGVATCPMHGTPL